MRALLLMLLALTLPATPARAAIEGPLIAPQTLAAAQQGADAALLLDIRPTDDFAAGHIPGAVSAPYDTWRGPAENPGMPLSPQALTERLQSAGVTFERPVVIVHQGADHNEFGAAARVYWTLKSAGHKRLSILNGGQGGWVAAGLPLSDAPAAVARSAIVPLALADWTATREQVAAAEAGEAAAMLVDARPEAFFRGLSRHPAAAEPGTLFGATSLTHATWFPDEKPLLAPDEHALARARALVAKADGAPVVSFCNTGHWAATNWFVLSELLGAPDVRLYPESVVGWSRAGLPLAPGE